jgi:hypothetical protein
MNDQAREGTDGTTDGAYTDTDPQSARHPDTPGEYTDVEREDGSIHKHADEGEAEGEYTDVDRT